MYLPLSKKRGYKKINSAVEDFVMKRCSAWNVSKTEVRLFLNWKDIVGESIASIARPGRVVFSNSNSGTLYLVVKSGGHAMFLQYAVLGIIEKISVYFGFRAISSIKITQ